MKTLRDPARGGLLILAAMGLVAGIEVDSDAVGDRCPPGKVLGSPGHCVFKAQCPDGTVPADGKCYSPDATPPQPEVVVHGCQTVLRAGPGGKPKPAAGCGGKEVPARKVFLANGKAFEVLGKYLHDAEQQGARVELLRLTVYFFDAHNAQRAIPAPQMTMAHYFSGKPMKDLWQKSLGDEVAQPRRDPWADAQKFEADVACGD